MTNAELNRFAARAEGRLDTLERLTESLGGDIRRLESIVNDLKRDLSLVERDIDELRRRREEDKKEREERWRRVWAFGPTILGVVLGGIITAAVNYFVVRR